MRSTLPVTERNSLRTLGYPKCSVHGRLAVGKHTTVDNAPRAGVVGQVDDGFVTVSRLHSGRIGGTIESRGAEGRTGAP